MKMKFSGAEVHELHEPLDVLAEIGRTEFGDAPVYLCDLADIIRKHVNWQQLMPRVVPHYAVKCNDSATVIGLLAALGASFDCASQGEIQKVLENGALPSNIIYANPAKPVSHLEVARAQGIRMMTFDGSIELHKIKRHYPNAQLVLRIRCDAKLAQYPLGEKFGCDAEKDAPGLLAEARDLGLEVIGISFHVGSGCLDLPVYAKAIQISKRLFVIGAKLGFRFSLLDIGGGFPGEKDTDLVELSKIVNTALDQHFADDDGVQIIAEPGRYYVSSAFTLVTRVHSKREVRVNERIDTRMYYINDGVFGSFCCNIYDQKVVPLQVVPVPVKPFKGPLHNSTIWGPTCDGLDQVCKNVALPEMQIDDLIMFENMGAYTIPLASSFNGFPLPIVKYYIDLTVVNALQQPPVNAFFANIV